MRLRTQVALYSVLISTAALTLAACSTHSNLAAVPATQGQSSTSQARGTSSVYAYPIALQSFPISLGAYPSGIGAIPISNAAYPICTTSTSAASCGGAKRTPKSSIAAGTSPSGLAGYQPVHLQGAYGVSDAAASQGNGRTIAIVTAGIMPGPRVANDLAVYRKTFGLPACSASPCFNLIFSGPPPNNEDTRWAEETAVDTQMASAICPLCNILVVVASSPNIPDLGKAVALAASYHPAVISNSYAVPEAADNAKYANYYNQPGITIVAGAGDSGYGVAFPAAVPSVIAVGGTTLTQNSDGTFAPQTVWTGTGSGCSSFFNKPAFQHDGGCTGRTVNDIAAVADPQTGVAAYSSYGGGWALYGGTSVAAPIIAGMYALAGHAGNDATNLYTNASGLAWISGSNGNCSQAYLCTASGQGYNGPAGVGVPYGLAAF